MIHVLGETAVLPVTRIIFTIRVKGAFLGAHRCVVPVHVVQSTGEGEQQQCKDDKELEDVHDHTAQRDLQRSQVRVDREHVDELQRAEDVGCSEHGLGHEAGIICRPVFTGKVRVGVSSFFLLLHL